MSWRRTHSEKQVKDETARTGPEKQPEKNIIMADIYPQNTEMEQSMQNGEEDHALGSGEGHQPAGNNRWGQAQRLALNFGWAIPKGSIISRSIGQ